ncbi:MAG: TetR/AcrR family transcriptional regulator [Bulleidia sp.]
MPVHFASKEEILRHCREIVQHQGLSALNMRTVAEECGMGLGSLYYYFPSKNALVIATIESVWSDLFRLEDSQLEDSSFPEYVRSCFERLHQGVQKYPNFFTIHSVSVSEDGRSEARETMMRYMDRILSSFRAVLIRDPRVRKDAFDESFSMDDFLNYVLESMIELLLRGHADCNVLAEMICRTLYEPGMKKEREKQV